MNIQIRPMYDMPCYKKKKKGYVLTFLQQIIWMNPFTQMKTIDEKLPRPISGRSRWSDTFPTDILYCVFLIQYYKCNVLYTNQSKIIDKSTAYYSRYTLWYFHKSMIWDLTPTLVLNLCPHFKYLNLFEILKNIFV